MVDFVVEIPSGKEPVILQLSDPQIIDSSKAPAGRLASGESEYWQKGKQEERCFKYIRETVNNVSPDLILIAGDMVYGEFDHDGSSLIAFTEFMDSFGIPWAPVLGNHETESKMGADWQCEQLQNAKYCLFKQRELTGNGNYSVGIKQSGKLLRAFFMLDSNSGHPSELSMANGHSSHPAGFGADQIKWYTDSISRLRENSPDTKISFVFHIALRAFEKAYEKYGYTRDKSSDVFPIILHGTNEPESDFGVILNPISCWDEDFTVWDGLKNIGVDSVFVGHNHDASAGIIYEGIRCQFGLKSSTYDSNIYLDKAGMLVKSWIPVGVPIIGGTVIKLDFCDGTIADIYHYKCKNVHFES